MNIQFDAQLLLDNYKTGIGWTAQKIIEGLAGRNKKNTYTLNYFALSNKIQKRGFLVDNFLRLGCRVNKCGWFDSSIYKGLYNFIPIPYAWFFGNKADITHFMNYHVPPGVKGKVITMIYDTVFKTFPNTTTRKSRLMLNLSMKRSCKRADLIITISQFSKSEIIKYLGVPSDKIVVMPCGVDFKLFRPDYDRKDIQTVKSKYGLEGDYLLYLGTLEPRKNIDRLIDGYALIKRRVDTPPKLVIAGRKGWQYDSIFKKVHQLNLSNDVIFTGYVDAADSPLLMKGAVAFVFPSLYEGFGLPPLEAMACGTPVITSNVASLPEVVGDAAMMVDPFSTESVADAMERVVLDAGLRSELSLRGLERASHYSWDNSVRIVEDAYNRLAENSSWR